MHGHPDHPNRPPARGRTWRRVCGLLPVAALLGSGLVFTVGAPASAAEITTFPERLYMAPEGTTLVAGLLGVPIGTLPFDGGTDIISQDVRSLVVDTVDGDAGCELIDEAVGVPDYDIDDCSRVQLDVGHGRLHLGAITTELRDYLTDPDGAGPLVAGSPNPNDEVYFLPSGATIDSEYQVPEGSLSIGINGTPQQLNDALADLVYTPDDGYWYVGSNPENLNMIVVPGNSDDVGVPPEERASDSLTVQIRVLDVNDFPTHDGPATKVADAQLPLVISNEYTVGDEDNDEIIDNNDGGDPPPLPDGEDADMLLIGWLTCGQPIAPNTGFHFGSSIFQSNDITLQDLLDTLFPVSENPANQQIQDAVNAGLDLIDPAIKDVEWATSDPTTPTTAFAGVSSIDEIQDALAQVTFLHNAPNDTCELVTVVSDLGNNGLPLQYVGTPFPADPLNDPFGIEIPFLGFDWNVLEITTGDLTEIDVSFTTPNVFVLEGSADNTALTQIAITPGTHPAFQIRWNAVPGTALPGFSEDYAGTSNNNPVIGQDVQLIPVDLTNVLGSENPIQTNVFDDNDAEGTETFTFEIEPAAFAPPPGYTITSDVSVATVTIIDDDDGPRSVSLGNASVVEGDSPDTAVLSVPVTLTGGPARGDEQVTISTGVLAGEATSGVDFTPLTDVVVDFELGQTQRLVPITVIGDDAIEDAEDFLVTISGSTNLTVSDGSATATIVDDDASPPSLISIASATSTEGGNLETTPITMTNPAGRLCVVDVTSADGSADAGADYGDYANTQVVLNGVASFDLALNVLDDQFVEPDETFTLSLAIAAGSDPGCALDGAGSATITIVSDDVASVISIADTSIPEVALGGPITVSMTNNVGRTCVVDAVSADGSAGAPADYTAIAPNTTLALQNAPTGDLQLAVENDASPEGPENFTVTITLNAQSDPQCQLGDAFATVTIIDDDTVVPSVVSIADGSVTEGVSGSTTVSMTNSAGRNCSVSVTSADGTAVAPGDYAAFQGGTFNLNGVASDVLGLSAVDDDLVESPETYTLTIALLPPPASDVNCVLGDAVATITITSDDVASVVSIADGAVAEGASATTTISMTSSANRTCSVSVTSTNGSAEAPGDYDAFAGGTFNLVNLPSDTLGISANDDAEVEGPESFTLTIALLPPPASDGQCTLGDSTATILIVDTDSPVDNTPPTVTIDQAVGQADPTSSPSIEFTAVFSEPVIGFQTGDVSLSGTAGAAIAEVSSLSSTEYSVTVSGMTQSGTVIVEVGPNVATDAASNPNAASSSTDNEVQYDLPPADITPPTVTINQSAAQVDPTSVSPIQFRVDFSEPVTGFETGDVSLSGTALPTIADVTPVTSSVYLVEVSGMSQSGTVIATVPADRAVDLANNPNVLSTSTDNEVQYNMPPADITPPTVTINQSAAQVDPTSVSPIQFRVDFSEPVTGFVTGDVSLSGTANPATASVTAVTSSVYLVEVSGMTQSGTVIATVPAGRAVDLANNPNALSSSTDNLVQYDMPLTLNLPPNQTANNDPGQAGAIVAYPAVTATGGVPPVVVDCAPISGSFFPLGTTTVSCTATDAEGQGQQAFQDAIVTGFFTVTVVDSEPPLIADNPDLTRETVGNAPVTVSFPLPAASDNSGVAPTVACSPASGSTFGVGVSTVTCTATDAAGNSASSSFTVTVTSTGSGVPGPTTPPVTTAPTTTNPIAGLPATGSDPQILLVVAVLLLAGGAVLVRGARRRTA